jgi:hypothetical protein
MRLANLLGWRLRGAVTALLLSAFGTLVYADDGSENFAPELLTFTVLEAHAGVYTLSGTINDDYPEGCFIQFGGALDGYYAVVTEDGSFTTTVEAGFYARGEVSAQAIDDVGQGSNVLWSAAL